MKAGCIRVCDAFGERHDHAVGDEPLEWGQICAVMSCRLQRRGGGGGDAKPVLRHRVSGVSGAGAPLALPDLPCSTVHLNLVIMCKSAVRQMTACTVHKQHCTGSAQWWTAIPPLTNIQLQTDRHSTPKPCPGN